MSNMIFIHGLESSGSGFKGRLLKREIPGILTPDFKGSLDKRMQKLNNILESSISCIIIGSSWGGLMATIYACNHPEKVSLLILLAPVLVHPELNSVSPFNDPVIIFHGKNDSIIPIKSTQRRAGQLFTNLIFNAVEDDHMLHPTVEAINWQEILKRK